MFTFLRSLFQNSNPGWDRQGRLRYLLARESDPAECAVAGVPSEAAECALRLFCEAFDVPDEQMFCLRPSDKIHDIYRSMAMSSSDEMEYERLGINLEEALGRSLTEEESSGLDTIEDLIRFVCEKLKF